jgi:hypothetical protein
MTCCFGYVPIVWDNATNRITFIVDGGSNLILALVDGILCDGGDKARRGWGRFSRRLMDLGGEVRLQISTSLRGRLNHLYAYNRPLRVSEAASITHRRRAE